MPSHVWCAQAMPIAFDQCIFFKSYNLLSIMNGTADIHASQNAAAAEQPLPDRGLASMY